MLNGKKKNKKGKRTAAQRAAETKTMGPSGSTSGPSLRTPHSCLNPGELYLESCRITPSSPRKDRCCISFQSEKFLSPSSFCHLVTCSSHCSQHCDSCRGISADPEGHALWLSRAPRASGKAFGYALDCDGIKLGSCKPASESSDCPELPEGCGGSPQGYLAGWVGFKCLESDCYLEFQQSAWISIYVEFKPYGFYPK